MSIATKLISLILITLIVVGCSTSKEVDKKTLMPGHNVKITKDCFGAVSKEAYDKLVSYTASQNTQAAEQMKKQGLLVVLYKEDIAELTEVKTGYVRMKMLNGGLKDREFYIFREMVEKIDQSEAAVALSQQQKQVDTLAYSNTGKYNLANISSSDVTEEQRSRYIEWYRILNSKISTYPDLDAKALHIMDEFKAGRITKSSREKVNSTWEEMDVIRLSLLKFNSPTGFSPAIDEELHRMLSDYRDGINDRMAGLWRVVMYCDGQLTIQEAKAEVDSCLKTSGNYFSNYERRRKEFQRIFGAE